jgi:hypothetical protein
MFNKYEKIQLDTSKYMFNYIPKIPFPISRKYGGVLTIEP